MSFVLWHGSSICAFYTDATNIKPKDLILGFFGIHEEGAGRIVTPTVIMKRSEFDVCFECFK